MSIFKKKINEFPTPYTCKNAVKKGGVETKLSMILMGFGNIVHGQIIKGLLYLAVEIALHRLYGSKWNWVYRWSTDTWNCAAARSMG